MKQIGALSKTTVDSLQIQEMGCGADPVFTKGHFIIIVTTVQMFIFNGVTF